MSSERIFTINENKPTIHDAQTKITYFLPPDDSDIRNTVPIAAISQGKMKLLKESVYDPKFYITIIDYAIHPTFISYRLELGRLSVDGEYICIKHVQTRYSQLYNLYWSLQKDSTFKHTLPPFPPKKWFNNLTRETAEQRKRDMSPFVESLNRYIEVRLNPLFEQMFKL